MYRRKFRKSVTVLILLIFAITSLGVTACTPSQQEEAKQISFVYTLTEQDVDEALDAILQLEVYIDSGKNRKIISAVDDMDEKIDYIHHQYKVAQVAYYSDLNDENAYNRYVDSEDNYLAVREESMRVLKKLFDSELSAKKQVFENWTEQELKELEVSVEEVVDLEQKQQELVRAYLALDNPGSEAWSKAMAEIYDSYIDIGQQLAGHYGYDNFYEYASKELYSREYTTEQREAFRQNVKDYILPFFLEVDDLYYEKKAQLTEEQKAQFDALRKDVCLADNAYLTAYIDSYPEQMKTTMYNLYDREAVIYTQSDSAHGVAYTSYSDYYDQPFIFFGNGYQDLLTVVHEMGHYVAFYHFAFNALPYDTCEVHSQANEWLMLNYLNGQIDPDVYETFLLYRLDYGLSIVVISTIVDEYEELMYTQDDILSPQQFKTVLAEVMEEYIGIETVISEEDFYIYSQYVTIETPVYYLSYATSELVSMLFYSIAEEQGYAYAQEIYIDLCLETPIDNLFFDTLMDVGLPDPFEKETIVNIIDAYADVFAEDDIEQAA